MEIKWDEQAWEDFLYWVENDKKILRKIKELIKDIDRNIYKGIGKPEPLRGNINGYWSRRIDDKNRIVYKVESNVIYFLQCGSHYRDK